MLKEFRDFIASGNVIEFAVAVIMAGAIGKVVNEFVDKIVMPIVGHFSGGMDFKEFKYVLDEATMDAAGKVATPENAILYGEWINAIINLIIVGLVMFFIIRSYNKMQPKEEEAPAGPSQEDLLSEIRDLLKK